MRLFSFLLLGVIVLIVGCQGNKTSKKDFDSINLQVRLSDTTSTDTLNLYAWTGTQVELHTSTPKTKIDKQEGFDFELEKVPEGMYYVGTSLQDMKPLLLGSEPLVVMEGDGKKFKELKISQSSENKDLEKAIEDIRGRNNQFVELMNQYRQPKITANQKEMIKNQLFKLDKEKRNFLDSLKEEGSLLARVAALNSFQSYENNAEKGETETDYFARSFFQFVNFEDSAYARLPFYYEAVKSFSASLSKSPVGATQRLKYVDSLMAKISKESALYKPTLLALAFGAMNNEKKIFIKYGNEYLKRYEGEQAVLDNFFKAQIAKLKGPAGLGDMAPNLIGTSPDGKTISLEDFRGKYVLIDFWASWCGPCRRENPNVVRMYNKYHEKGFEILGVSLDRDKARWEKAIKSDQLKWPHISDLKGWQSDHAKLYGVRGIPYTVLVDKEGRIIAQRLRGPSLEAKLKQIFNGY